MADLILLVHAAVALFIVAGLPAVVLGHRLGWRWVDSLRFRLLHLAAIGLVVAQSWLGIDCPLTVLEARLRAEAGSDLLATGFVAHWVQRLLFYSAPSWVFTLVYTGFAVLVLIVWWVYPPRWGGARSGS